MAVMACIRPSSFLLLQALLLPSVFLHSPFSYASEIVIDAVGEEEILLQNSNAFSSITPLSWAAPRIYHYPQFLSNSECDYLIATAKKSPQFSIPKKGVHDQLTSVYVDWDAIYSDPMIESIEKRIGVVTAIPPHQHEEPINIHRILPMINDKRGNLPVNQETCQGGPKDCLRNISGIHHDKVQKEYSAATVLVYLNDIDIGGGTVWPCRSELPEKDKKMKTDDNEQGGGSLSEACKRAFEKGARWFDGKETTVVGKMKKMKKPTSADADLQDILWHAHLACSAPSPPASMSTAPSPGHIAESSNHHPTDNLMTFKEWKRPPVRSKPKKGDAIVFFHDHPNGDADPFAWHAGCLPISNEKWTMQKFKEMPMVFRK